MRAPPGWARPIVRRTFSAGKKAPHVCLKPQNSALRCDGHFRIAGDRENPMAFIGYVAEDDIPHSDRVPDRDHIIRIHGVHSRTMKHHYELYRELMRGPGPLTLAQREMIAVVVSSRNGCHY